MPSSHKKNKRKRQADRVNSNPNLPKERGELTELQLSSPYFEVQSSEEIGRYLISSKTIEEGIIIFKEIPLVVGPVQESQPVCLGCYSSITDIENCFKCIRCKWPMCEKNCKGLHTRFGHSLAECVSLSTIPESDLPSKSNAIDPYNAIVPFRCLLLKKEYQEEWRKIMAMESHNNIRSKISSIWENNQMKVVNRIRLKWGFQEFTENEIHTICGILEVNSFAIGQESINLRALYPTIFLLAHDCTPNTAHKDDDNYVMTLRTSMRVPRGQRLTVTYASTLVGTLDRRKSIWQSKFFYCSCKRCSDKTELGTMMSAIQCCCKEGFLLPELPLDPSSTWTCSENCNFTISAEEVTDLLNKAQHDFERNKGESIEEFETYLKSYESIFHPNHYHMITAKFALSQMYGRVGGFLLHEMSTDLLQRKLDICESLLKVFNKIEPGLSRIRGVTLYELHAPLMILTTSEHSRGMISKVELKKKLRRVVEYLKESYKILKFETETSPEGLMATAAKQALEQTKHWNLD